MIEGENKVSEKNQFNGNLALLRVCSIALIVNVACILIGLFFVAVRGGMLASLWSALTTSSFEDLLGTGGLLVVSGLIIPIALGVFATVIALGSGIFALVKKNVIALKVVAVIMFIWAFTGPVILGFNGEIQKLPSVIASLIFNVNLVVAVTAFIISRKKCVEENNEAVVHDGFNLGLYRFCAVCFLVVGLAGMVSDMFGYAISLPLILLYFTVAVASAFALVKKNTDILVACSLAMIALIIWRIVQITSTGELDIFLKATTIVHCFCNTTVVVCVAAFFIEPERIRRYRLIFKRSNS